jgi:hypothetical protein
MKINEFLFKNGKLIGFASLALIIICTTAWWQHKQTQEEKLTLDRARIGEAFRQVGIASAKMQQAQRKAIVQEDELAPHQLSGDAELVQAKLWQSLPKDKRAIMQTETINAGLAAKPSNE